MNRSVLGLAGILVVAFAGTFANAAVETRCGWVFNPSPANVWLIDAKDEWTIGIQGGYQAEGDLAYPEREEDKVKTNNNYGYWCGCVTGTFDSRERNVLTITSSTVQSLNTCLEDPNLSAPAN